jgi:ubiquitin C-terminal hydrolase
MSDDIKRYNIAYAIPPLGFVNLGATCYFNGMLQSMLGCTALNELLSQETERKRNTLTQAYASLIDNAIAGRDISGLVPKIWEAFSNEMREQKRNFAIGKSSHSQEDAQEALTLFLECLQSRTVNRLFEHRYRYVTKCVLCGYETPDRIDEGVTIDVHIGELGTTSLRDHLIIHSPDISGDDTYVCTKCGGKGRGTKTQSRRLSMLPEVIIVHFKKYGEAKWAVPFPETMQFPVAGGFRSYKIISQTEHSGSKDSGHYWARSLRKDGQVHMLNDLTTIPSRWEPTLHTTMVWYHA